MTAATLWPPHTSVQHKDLDLDRVVHKPYTQGHAPPAGSSPLGAAAADEPSRERLLRQR